MPGGAILSKCCRAEVVTSHFSGVTLRECGRCGRVLGSDSAPTTA